MGIKVRQKGKKLYLDIYVNGKRTWEALNLTMTNDPTTNKETMRLAEFARAKREQQVFSGQWGLQDKVNGESKNQVNRGKTLFFESSLVRAGIRR